MWGSMHDLAQRNRYSVQQVIVETRTIRGNKKIGLYIKYGSFQEMRFLSCNIVQRIQLQHVLIVLRPKFKVFSRAVIAKYYRRSNVVSWIITSRVVKFLQTFDEGLLRTPLVGVVNKPNVFSINYLPSHCL